MGKGRDKRAARVKVHRNKYAKTPHWTTAGAKTEHEAAMERHRNYYNRKKK